MIPFIFAYIASLIAFVTADTVWLLFVVRKVYDIELGDVLRDKPKRFSAALFYLVYVAGIIAFGVWPMSIHLSGIHAIPTSYAEVAGWGAGLGLFGYASFALTAHSLIKQWRYKLVFADLLWGSVLTAGACLIGFAVHRTLL